MPRSLKRAGNKQYIGTGNLMSDNRVALILMDYPRQLRLKILGRVDIFEGDVAAEWLGKVRDPKYKAVTERVYVIRIEAFDWNCQQHIIPRYTEDEIREATMSFEQHMQELVEENERLRHQLAQCHKNP